MFMDLVLEIRNLSQIVYLLDFQVVFDKNSTNGLYFMFTYEEIEYDNINYVFICATTLHLYIRYYQKFESISHIILLYILILFLVQGTMFRKRNRLRPCYLKLLSII